ncbi:MAG TPA: undecaprenyldiphospho-muramoylpentapeptide beta-N-acetylglucosaminyltransferase [Clostridiaceae bacterium]|nr:undecaprenyldiphospho-muramoylpentapeptide beta-N-acetylglucosaminyltransferase [Clostridiaceae bacterium]
MSSKQRTVVFSGGGTSGHINPAIAVAQRLREDDPDTRIVFLGTAHSMESKIVPRAGFAFHKIKARGFPHRPGKELWQAYSEFKKGMRQSLDLMADLKPDVVVGTGGYVCGPVLAAAKRLHIPHVIHEQNAFPGRNNRLMARGADVVCISYERTRKYFHRAQRVVLTGNPVREVFYNLDRMTARRQFGIDEQEYIILATGGSLGARRINQAIIQFVRQNPDLPARVILACGERMVDETVALAQQIPPQKLRIEPYIFDIQLYMAAADLLICRAGAITCAEIAALGRGAILVPYPYAAADHQTWNARVFSDVGAALLCPDAELTGDWLSEHIPPLIRHPERLEDMEEKVKQYAMPDSVIDIVREIKLLYRD